MLKFGLLSPDALVGVGGNPPPATPPVEPPPPPKTFEDAKGDFDSQLAGQRRSHDREMRRRDKEMEALKKEYEDRLSGLETNDPVVPAAPVVPAPSNLADGDVKVLAGQIELLKRQQERDKLEASKRLEDAERRAEEERMTRQRLQRDSMIDEALRLSACSPNAYNIARSHFLEHIVQDDLAEDPESWVFKTKEGNYVSILQGMQEEMPDILKAPATARGGSGSIPAGTPGAVRHKLNKELEDALTELKRIETLGHQSGGRSDLVSAFQRQTRAVKSIKDKLGKA